MYTFSIKKICTKVVSFCVMFLVVIESTLFILMVILLLYTASAQTTSGKIRSISLKNGLLWDSPPFVANITFPDGHRDNLIIDNPQNFPGSLPGVYTINSVVSPPGVTFTGITPSTTQTLNPGGVISFIANFVTAQPIKVTIQPSANVNITISRTPVTSSASPFKVGDATSFNANASPSLFASNLTVTGYTQIGTNTPRISTTSTFALRDSGACNAATGRCIIPGNWDTAALQCPARTTGVQQMTEWYAINSIVSNKITWYFQCSGGTPPPTTSNVLPIGATAVYKGDAKIWVAYRANQNTILFFRWNDPLKVIWRAKSQNGVLASESSSEIYYRPVTFYNSGVPADTFGVSDGPYDIWLTSSGLYTARNGGRKTLVAQRIGFGMSPAWYSKQWCGLNTICNKASLWKNDLWNGWPIFGVMMQKASSKEVTAIYMSPFSASNFETSQFVIRNESIIDGVYGETCTPWTTMLGLCKSGRPYNVASGEKEKVIMNGNSFQWWVDANSDNIPDCNEFGPRNVQYPDPRLIPHGTALKVTNGSTPTRRESTWQSSKEGDCR
jgi:hypothetical protein